jgi:catechol 2,3-dioxygenase-like lactoylglutathione lyase family enzyme
MSLAHFTIATRDVDRTTEFFVDLMGWREIPVPDNVEVKVRWIDLGNGAQMHVLGIHDFEPSPFEKEYGRHFAFFVSAERLGEIKERLPRDYGIPIQPPLRPTPFERFFFHDPNGYLIEVIDQDNWKVEA